MKVKNKTAQQVSSNTYVILNCVSVETEDAYQAVNDTTSATLAASKLITARTRHLYYAQDQPSYRACLWHKNTVKRWRCV
eukprot:9588061-Ditylum_brightwellii.AAC.1